MRRVLDHGHNLTGTQDDGASESVFLQDPDGKGIELYYDRPRKPWIDGRGKSCRSGIQGRNHNET